MHCLHRYTGIHGTKVHDSGMQTSCLGGKAVKGKEKRKAKGVINGDAADRLKIVMRLVDSMALWPHLHMVMSNDCGLATYIAGEPVYIKKGTKV